MSTILFPLKRKPFSDGKYIPYFNLHFFFMIAMKDLLKSVKTNIRMSQKFCNILVVCASM